MLLTPLPPVPHGGGLAMLAPPHPPRQRQIQGEEVPRGRQHPDQGQHGQHHGAEHSRVQDDGPAPSTTHRCPPVMPARIPGGVIYPTPCSPSHVSQRREDR